MTPREVLHGLAPDLIINLAQLAPSDPPDLAITIQLMPFGDRTALLAYGAIDYDRRRQVRVLPFFYDLADAALNRVCEWARTTGFSG